MTRRALLRQISASFNRLTSGNNATFPILNASDHGYRPAKGEKLLAVHDSVRRMDWVATGAYTYGGTSVSIRVARGVRLNVGNGTVHRPKEWRAISTGRLLLTSHALVFEGDASNDRWTWNQLATVRICVDGYTIHRRRGKPVAFGCKKVDPDFCAIVCLMLHRVE
jgi:hypothetical protein